jgi:glycosyltransferase involved in cell wall biosynthesis
MESWLAGRPALVHADCAVTRGHVERAKGGLWFRTYDEFVGVIEWLRGNAALAAQMGQNGRRYVLENYTWDAVASRFEAILEAWGRDE